MNTVTEAPVRRPLQINCAPRLSGHGLIAAAVFGSLWGSAAIAQQAPKTPAPETGQLEEVIVTAQYRRENLQDTPIAITAVQGDRLEEQSIASVKDLGRIIPNANFVQAGAGNGPNSTIGMRGVNTTDFIYTSDPGVGVYVDDVYHGTLTGSDMDLLDLDRVEVLRGPQGTLFGKNSLGGAIRLFSKQPQGDDTGSIDVTYGTSHRLDVKGFYDFRVAENLFMRVSAASKQIDGYQTILDFACQMRLNGTPELAGTATAQFPTFVPSNSQNQGNCKIGEQGGSRSNSGKIMLRYLATDDLEFNLDADYSKTVSQPPADSLLAGYHAPAPGGFSFDWFYGQTTILPRLGVLPDDRFLTGDPFTTYAFPADPIDGKRFPFDQTTDAWSTTGKLDYNFTDSLHLKIIGAYRTYQSNWLGTLIDMPIDLHDTYNEQYHKQTTLEARFTGTAIGTRLDWNAGAYLYDSSSVLGGFVTLPAFAAILPNFDQNDHFTTKSKSGFLHGIFKVTDAMSLTAGARYTSEKKTYAFDHTNFLTVGAPLHYGSNNVDYKVSIDYRWNPELLTYVSYSTGFRSDGAQPRPFDIGQQQTPNAAEKLKSLEVGAKTDFFDRRLRVNLALFADKYDPRLTGGFGSQCNLPTDPDPGPIFTGLTGTNPCPASTPLAGTTGIPWFYFTSAPGKDRGVELELSATPVDKLQVDLSGGYYNYRSDVARTAVGFIDSSVRQQPSFTGSVGAQYAINMAGGSLIPRVDVFYTGYKTNRGDLSLPVRPSDDIVPGYTLLNLRLTYLASDGKWSASLAAENLLDKFYWASLASATGSVPGDPSASGATTDARTGVPGRGREVAFTLRRSFD
jgi:iron complex outermembrane recepter protein